MPNVHMKTCQIYIACFYTCHNECSILLINVVKYTEMLAFCPKTVYIKKNKNNFNKKLVDNFSVVVLMKIPHIL